MKSGELARLFGVSSETVRQWSEMYASFLSFNPRDQLKRQRLFTENDILILATVAELSTKGKPHSEIRKSLESGYRVENPGIANFAVDSRLVPAAVVEQVIDSSELRSEIARVLVERDRLLADLERERKKNETLETKIENLQSRLEELLIRVGKAEGKLEEIYENRKPKGDSP